MKIIYSILIIVFCYNFTIGQESNGTFAKVIGSQLPKYNKETNLAFAKNEMQLGQELFDTLVSKHLIGTTFEDYTLKSFEKKKVKLSSFKKPVFILTYASWCIPSKGEIPALNKLAQKYSKDIKFVVLFWNKKHELKQIARKFNHNITVCYAHETYKNDAVIISHLKHTLGFPTLYFLDSTLKVVNITRGGEKPDLKSPYVKAFTMNYNAFREGLASLLVDKNIKDEQLTTN